MRHECDCGSVYTNIAALMACAAGNHGQPQLTYDEWVDSVWHGKGDLQDLFVFCVGLAGELGEALELIKKQVRDGAVVDRHEFALELGDVLYYLTKLAHWQGYKLTDVMALNRAKIDRRQATDPRQEAVEAARDVEETLAKLINAGETELVSTDIGAEAICQRLTRLNRALRRIR